MKLPILISVPHAGLSVPPEVAEYNLLTEKEIAGDGDEQAAEIYDFEELVEAYVTTDVARAFVDMNREVNDRRKDGVVKTHTCWDVPIYRKPLPERVVGELLAKYHIPYHTSLETLSPRFRLCLDCHTMAAVAPPVGPDPGEKRPFICLSNAQTTCAAPLLMKFKKHLEEEFRLPVSVNDPFEGGHIIRRHSTKAPWIQVEFIRGGALSSGRKRQGLLRALGELVKFIDKT
ncbi:MAG: N-formylglutamate amidohydrolase [Nitrospinota bacterium]|nr:N-formylglutamate amidohydrolase [Nitrospinota bacterium]